MIVVGISLSGTPGCGVSIDSGASGVGDSHEVEGENAERSHSRAGCDRASRPYIAAVIKVVNMIYDLEGRLWELINNWTSTGVKGATSSITRSDSECNSNASECNTLCR